MYFKSLKLNEKYISFFFVFIEKLCFELSDVKLKVFKQIKIYLQKNEIRPNTQVQHLMTQIKSTN